MTARGTTHSPVFLTPNSPPDRFPDPELALREPNGLLAVGGDLSIARLKAAYHNGIFPWFNDGEPILWWSPDPRAVLFPRDVHVTRSLRKTINKQPFRVSFDEAFEQVISSCAAPRQRQPGTWITRELKAAYCALHRAGIAHSVECWDAQGQLVGGLYGIALGRVFFGESMFSRHPDASKIALVYLCRQLDRWGFELIDCQVASEHLTRMGAVLMARTEFTARVRVATKAESIPSPWRFDTSALNCGD